MVNFKKLMSTFIIVIALISILDVDLPYRKIILRACFAYIIIVDFLYPLLIKMRKK